MASIVINDLEARAALAGGSICVAYVYFRYSDTAESTVRSMLEIFVKQTAERHADCALLAEQAYARHICEGTQPSEAELLELLGQFNKAKSATYYVLDALDEAPERLRVALLKCLTFLNVRLFVTSRPLKDVERRFPKVCSFPIVAQDGDLDLHIKKQMSNNSALEELLEGADDSFKSEIVSLIKKKCGGMFLHASLQLKAISQCTSLHDVIETLESFPSEMETVDQQTWERICRHPSNNARLSKVVLVWVLSAARSMTMNELRHAISTCPDTYSFEPKSLIPTSILLSMCCGLLALEEETKLVRLVHYTAKNPLERLLAKEFPSRHSLPAAVCITHLDACGFQDTLITSEEEYTAALLNDPLLAYATYAWAKHARASIDVPDIQLRTANFIAGCRTFPSYNDPERLLDFDFLGPLHILSLFNFSIDLLRGKDTGDPNIGTEIVKEAPLMMASRSGNARMAQDLLSLPDIQVNHRDIDGTSALMIAAEEGHEPVVKMLLARPEIEVNVIDNFGRAPLISSAQRGHGHIALILLARSDIQVNLLNSRGWPALAVAVANGHESLASLILLHPQINVNWADNMGWTLLMHASCWGQEKFVEFLLERQEILVNLLDYQGMSAIARAAQSGHDNILKLLLARPDIQVNTTDDKGWSPLMGAAFGGHDGVVRLLAHPDILIDCVSPLGSSALTFAESRGHTECARLLRERDAH